MLSKVVLMILTINFLKLVVDIEISEPLDLLYLGAGIALVSLALILSHGKDISESTLMKRLKNDSDFHKIVEELAKKTDKAK